MSTIISFVPGVIGATVAYLALGVFNIFDLQSILMKFALFLVVYVITAALADRAMKAYAARKR